MTLQEVIELLREAEAEDWDICESKLLRNAASLIEELKEACEEFRYTLMRGYDEFGYEQYQEIVALFEATIGSAIDPADDTTAQQKEPTDG